MMTLQFTLLALGGAFLVLDFLCYAKRRFTPTIALIWLFFSGITLLFALLPFWHAWMDKVNPVLPLPIVLLVIVVVFGMFLLSMAMSRQIDRNRELAMQISLLNHENERLLKALREQGLDV